MPSDEQTILVPDIHVPPQYCQYPEGPCDQDYGRALAGDGLFLYPTEPDQIAGTIEAAVAHLRRVSGQQRWNTWKDLGVTGQIIFCEICKAMRFTRMVVADVTTLNFNLLFEVGYALGLKVPVLPIRDTSFKRDQLVFDEVGVLDTFGYFDFQNSEELSAGVLARQGLAPLGVQTPAINVAQPLFVVKSPVENDGAIKLMSVLKKSGLRFRTFDPRETPRLSLHEAYKQTVSSRAVVLHLLSPERGEEAHNARCAFLGGLAMAAGRHVLMLQEGQVRHPIDYRDVIRSYTRASQIQDLLTPILRAVIEELQPLQFVPTALRLTPLEKIDLGDVAAENEIRALDSYFVPTAQFYEAKRGHARLVVGRKGTGKTAVFYGVRGTYRRSKAHLVLDLKPEGHQFTKLREAVVSGLTEGVQQHLLTAFWNYLLIIELARQIVTYDNMVGYSDVRLRPAFERVRQLYGPQDTTEQGDFSERLLRLVDDIAGRRSQIGSFQTTGDVTELVHSHDIRHLNDALAEYLSISRREVWLLFDNLDKSWPVRAARPEDILLLRSLLEATRKLQRQLDNRGIGVHSIVFIRNDIYQHLLLEPGDRGKDTAVLLKWNDPEAFKEVIGRRISQSTNASGSFDELWPLYFVTHVREQPSFEYILGRTLMRPREVLKFVRECINVAINRRRERVSEDDILYAERAYSDDALVDISLELKDVQPAYVDIPYAFVGSKATLSRQELEVKLSDAGVQPTSAASVIELLLWFGFLGAYVREDDERYSYQYDYNLTRMTADLQLYAYTIHPAFRAALGCTPP